MPSESASDAVGPVRILAISGSLREGSSNSVLLHAAAAVTPAHAHLTIWDGLAGLPHFNPDLDGPRAPASVLEFRARVASADGLLISSPEYAHGVPGTLKNALDWLVSGQEIIAMPVALLNASPRSTHAHAALSEILMTMSATVIAEASRAVPMAGRPLDVSGILTDPERAQPPRAAVAALVEASARSRAARSRAVAQAWSDPSRCT